MATAPTTFTVLLKPEFSVEMTCESCSNVVILELNKVGEADFDIDLPNKKVLINSEHSVNTQLETLDKTGKAVSYLAPK
ncbi:copper transport protein ATOX1-like [Lutra lutra]|uniref:copper transport protein ATOX1-like n=1 Tax=Lutra lutra TaxID=9657 RepID=UPI001FD1D23D|nr:copper transport protein ATOX1-like [Lutra lutra]